MDRDERNLPPHDRRRCEERAAGRRHRHQRAHAARRARLDAVRPDRSCHRRFRTCLAFKPNTAASPTRSSRGQATRAGALSEEHAIARARPARAKSSSNCKATIPIRTFSDSHSWRTSRPVAHAHGDKTMNASRPDRHRRTPRNVRTRRGGLSARALQPGTHRTTAHRHRRDHRKPEPARERIRRTRAGQFLHRRLQLAEQRARARFLVALAGGRGRCRRLGLAACAAVQRSPAWSKSRAPIFRRGGIKICRTFVSAATKHARSGLASTRSRKRPAR